MEELTNVVVEETEGTEESGTSIGVGTVVTGVCAVTGIVAIAYGAVKGVKWVANKVKTAKNNKVEVLDANATEAAKANAVEAEVE